MSGLRIAFFGSSLVSAYWNGAATYYRGIIRALHNRGHRITFFEPDAYSRQEHRDIPDPVWAKVVVYQADQRGVNQALSSARGFDLVIKASGVGVYDEFLEQAVLNLRGSAAAAFWDVDAPATIDRVNRNPMDPFRKLIPQYDYIFTYGGGLPVVNAYLGLGARECTPVYNAFDPLTHFPVRSEGRFACDLSFLGNRLPDREKRVEEFFLRPAACMPDRTFNLGGNGWHDKPLSKNIKYLGHVYTRDHNSFNCSSTAVLNVCRESMARNGFSPATRVFEAAAAGACIITDYWEGIEEFLSPDSEILVAKDGQEVCCILSDLTRDRALSIGRAARRRVLREHTYEHRAEQLESLLGVNDRSKRVSL